MIALFVLIQSHWPAQILGKEKLYWRDKPQHLFLLLFNYPLPNSCSDSESTPSAISQNLYWIGFTINLPNWGESHWQFPVHVIPQSGFRATHHLTFASLVLIVPFRRVQLLKYWDHPDLHKSPVLWLKGFFSSSAVSESKSFHISSPSRVAGSHHCTSLLSLWF